MWRSTALIFMVVEYQVWIVDSLRTAVWCRLTHSVYLWPLSPGEAKPSYPSPRGPPWCDDDHQRDAYGNVSSSSSAKRFPPPHEGNALGNLPSWRIVVRHSEWSLWPHRGIPLTYIIIANVFNHLWRFLFVRYQCFQGTLELSIGERFRIVLLGQMLEHRLDSCVTTEENFTTK